MSISGEESVTVAHLEGKKKGKEHRTESGQIGQGQEELGGKATNSSTWCCQPAPWLQTHRLAPAPSESPAPTGPGVQRLFFPLSRGSLVGDIQPSALQNLNTACLVKKYPL